MNAYGVTEVHLSLLPGNALHTALGDVTFWMSFQVDIYQKVRLLISQLTSLQRLKVGPFGVSCPFLLKEVDHLDAFLFWAHN